MQTRNTAKWIFFGALIGVSLPAITAVVSRVTTFSDGSYLFASDLNSEFNNLVNNMNALDNDNIVAGAAISPAKISGAIAGDGISRNGSTGALSVNDDDSTLTISSNVLIVKDSGISTAKIANSAVTTAKIADSNVTTAKIADSNVTTAKIADSNVTTAKIADGAVTQAKRAALGQQISSASGSFSVTSNTLTDITNLSVTITTTGRPVFIGMIGNGSSSSSVAIETSSIANAGVIAFDRGGTVVSRQLFGPTGNLSGTSSPTFDYPCSSFSYIEVPSAGTYTYKAQAAYNVVLADTIYVTNCKLVAYEL